MSLSAAERKKRMRLSHSPMPGNRDSPLGPLNTGRQQGVASPHTLRVATGTTSTGNDLFEVGCWLGSLHQPSRVSESGPPQGLGFWAAAPPASPSSRGPPIRTRTRQPLPIRTELHGGHGFRVAGQGKLESIVWLDRGGLSKRWCWSTSVR